MNAIRFVPSARFSDAELADLFTRCYAGYYSPMVIDGPALRRMIELWDIDLDSSRVAIEGELPVGLVQLGVRGDRGWIGGMGVVAEARGRGLGAGLMDEALASARGLGLSSVDLEVLVQNREAIPIYERCGFVRTRRLRVLRRAEAKAPEPSMPVDAVEIGAVLDDWDRLHARRSPWQRASVVIGRLSDGAEARGVAVAGRLEASVVSQVRPGVIQIADLGARPDARAGALESVIAANLAAHPELPHVLVNLPEDDPATAAMEALGFEEHHAQHEMTCRLA